MKVELTFTEPLLGTKSGDPKITEEFIASKHPEGHSQEEVDTIPVLEEVLEKTSTVFNQEEDGRRFIWDYQVKGFLKSACEQMINSATMTKEELKKFRLTQYLYKKTIDKQIFVLPRRIYLELPVGQETTYIERPLRGETMRGERICLVRSESCPIGTKCRLEIVCLNKHLEKFIKNWLKYGALFGLGQWRSSGMGRFDFFVL